MIVAMDENVAEVARWVRGRRYGTVQVLDVEVSWNEDSTGQRAVYYDLTLTDPAAGEETWPYDDLRALYWEVDAKAESLLGQQRWHVRLLPFTLDDYDDEEDAWGGL